MGADENPAKKADSHKDKDRHDKHGGSSQKRTPREKDPKPKHRDDDVGNTVLLHPDDDLDEGLSRSGDSGKVDRPDSKKDKNGGDSQPTEQRRDRSPDMNPILDKIYKKLETMDNLADEVYKLKKARKTPPKQYRVAYSRSPSRERLSEWDSDYSERSARSHSRGRERVRSRSNSAKRKRRARKSPSPQRGTKRHRREAERSRSSERFTDHEDEYSNGSDADSSPDVDPFANLKSQIAAGAQGQATQVDPDPKSNFDSMIKNLESYYREGEKCGDSVNASFASIYNKGLRRKPNEAQLTETMEKISQTGKLRQSSDTEDQ